MSGKPEKPSDSNGLTTPGKEIPGAQGLLDMLGVKRPLDTREAELADGLTPKEQMKVHKAINNLAKHANDFNEAKDMLFNPQHEKMNAFFKATQKGSATVLKDIEQYLKDHHITKEETGNLAVPGNFKKFMDEHPDLKQKVQDDTKKAFDESNAALKHDQELVQKTIKHLPDNALIKLGEMREAHKTPVMIQIVPSDGAPMQRNLPLNKDTTLPNVKTL